MEHFNFTFGGTFDAIA